MLGHRALEPHSYAMPRISLRCTDLPPVPAARQLDQPPILIVPRLRRQKPAAGRSEFCPLTASQLMSPLGDENPDGIATEGTAFAGTAGDHSSPSRTAPTATSAVAFDSRGAHSPIRSRGQPIPLAS